MAKRKNLQTGEYDGGVGFKDYLEYNGNVEGLEYIRDQESAGHKLTVKGGGAIRYYVIETIYGYDVFDKDENKAKFASLLQSSTDIGTAAVTLAYNVIPGSAHVLVKGDTEDAADGYIAVINKLFEESYDDGKRSVGYPFRTSIKVDNVRGTNAIWNTIGTILGYSPVAADAYPYNCYAFLMGGKSLANMVLGIELRVIDPNTFRYELSNRIVPRPYRRNYAPEKMSKVLEDLKKRYVYPYARVKEDVLAMVLGETCARSGVPYMKVAKKMKLYKGRHDLTVTTLCSLMIRRGVGFDTATTLLKLGNENPTNLLIETLAELNRLTGYSYEYIVRQMMQVNDKGYPLLVTTFQHLHAAYGWNFPELCEKFHVVKDAIYIGSLCGF